MVTNQSAILLPLIHWVLGYKTVKLWKNFQTSFSDWYLGHFLWACLIWMGQNIIDDNYTSEFNEVEMEYTVFTLSVCPSIHLSLCPTFCLSVCHVHLWMESCQLGIINNAHWIHYIYIYIIKQLQKVCCKVFCKISRFDVLAKFSNLLTLSCFDLGLNMNQFGNHGVAWGILRMKAF